MGGLVCALAGGAKPPPRNWWPLSDSRLARTSGGCGADYGCWRPSARTCPSVDHTEPIFEASYSARGLNGGC